MISARSTSIRILVAEEPRDVDEEVLVEIRKLLGVTFAKSMVLIDSLDAMERHPALDASLDGLWLVMREIDPETRFQQHREVADIVLLRR
jgi:hypothetical protein